MNITRRRAIAFTLCVITTDEVDCLDTSAFGRNTEDPNNAEKIIERLGCKLPAPKISSGMSPPSFSKDATRSDYAKAFAPVYEAIDSLIDMGEAAFPTLAASEMDSRYALTQQRPVSGVWYNMTRGDVCEEIISKCICIYAGLRERHTPHGNPIGYIRELNSSSFGKWWSDNRRIPLWKMQRDGILWALENDRPEFCDNSINESIIREWKLAVKNLKKDMTFIKPIFSSRDERILVD